MSEPCCFHSTRGNDTDADAAADDDTGKGGMEGEDEMTGATGLGEMEVVDDEEVDGSLANVSNVDCRLDTLPLTVSLRVQCFFRPLLPSSPSSTSTSISAYILMLPALPDRDE